MQYLGPTLQTMAWLELGNAYASRVLPKNDLGMKIDLGLSSLRRRSAGGAIWLCMFGVMIYALSTPDL